MFYDPADQGDCNNFHQPKQAAPQTYKDQTLPASEAAHSFEWTAEPGERLGGLLDQPELVCIFVLFVFFCPPSITGRQH